MGYFDVKAYSASAIKAGAVSMLQMWHEIEHGKEKSAAMFRGAKQHMAILEPEKLAALTLFDGDKRKKEYKDLKEQVGEENIITPQELEQFNAALAQVRNNPIVKDRDLFADGEAEKEIYWKENGIDCKCKVDWFADDYIVEYKTTGQIERFIPAAASMRYHLQLAWYWRGACQLDGKQKRVYIVAQEQKAPFDVAVFTISPLMLKMWFKECMNIVERYESGDRTGAFPVLMQFELPAWADDTDFSSDDIQF